MDLLHMEPCRPSFFCLLQRIIEEASQCCNPTLWCEPTALLYCIDVPKISECSKTCNNLMDMVLGVRCVKQFFKSFRFFCVHAMLSPLFVVLEIHPILVCFTFPLLLFPTSEQQMLQESNGNSALLISRMHTARSCILGRLNYSFKANF